MARGLGTKTAEQLRSMERLVINFGPKRSDRVIDALAFLAGDESVSPVEELTNAIIKMADEKRSIGGMLLPINENAALRLRRLSALSPKYAAINKVAEDCIRFTYRMRGLVGKLVDAIGSVDEVVQEM